MTKEETIKAAMEASSDKEAAKLMVQYLRGLDTIDVMIELTGPIKEIANNPDYIERMCVLHDLLLEIREEEKAQKN